MIVSDKPLFVSKNKQVDAIINQQSDSTVIQLLEKISLHPHSFWLEGSSEKSLKDLQSYLEQAKNQVVSCVVYNIPKRDNSGLYSAGGIQNSELYKKWILALGSVFAQARETTSLIILEPDGLCSLNSGGLNHKEKTQRVKLIQFASDTFSKISNCRVYIDIGNPNWLDVNTASQLLNETSTDKKVGFCLNTSNFVSDTNNKQYGYQISYKTNGKKFIIDTSRNGRGADPNLRWCNPPGRGLGRIPTLKSGDPLIDGYLWIKTVGTSDGELEGAPRAGEWYMEYALELARNAAF